MVTLSTVSVEHQRPSGFSAHTLAFSYEKAVSHASFRPVDAARAGVRLSLSSAAPSISREEMTHPEKPRLLKEYSLASAALASPMRASPRTRSVTASRSLSTEFATVLTKALNTVIRCTSPPHEIPLSSLGWRWPLGQLQPEVAERILSYLGAEDMAAASVACRKFYVAVPAAATQAAQRFGFHLRRGGFITRRLHTFEMQVWLAGRIIEQLTSVNRPTREQAIMRCASLPLPALAHHDLELLELTMSDDPAVRLRALRTLSQLSAWQITRLLERRSASLRSILPRLIDDDEYVRRAALTVVEMWTSKGALINLDTEVVDAVGEICLSDENELVRLAAERFLQGLTAE